MAQQEYRRSLEYRRIYARAYGGNHRNVLNSTTKSRCCNEIKRWPGNEDAVFIREQGTHLTSCSRHTTGGEIKQPLSSCTAATQGLRNCMFFSSGIVYSQPSVLYFVSVPVYLHPKTKLIAENYSRATYSF